VPGAPNPQKGKKARTPKELELLAALKAAKENVIKRTLEQKLEKLPKEDPTFVQYQAALAAIHIFRNSKGTEKAESKTEIPSQASTGVQNTPVQASAATVPTQSVPQIQQPKAIGKPIKP